MALRLSFATVIVVPLLCVACGETKAPASGASPQGVIAGAAGVGGGAPGSSEVAGASAGLGGPNGGAGAALSSSGGRAGSGASFGGGAAGVSSGGASGGQSSSLGGSGGTAGALSGGGTDFGGGASGGSSSEGGNGGTAGGVPSGWIVVGDVDYSQVPGPNFETVRLMFEGAQCSGSSCHYGGKNHFQVGKAADELYSYMIKFKTLQCGKLIDTTNPSASALVKYLRGPCGDTERMPPYVCAADGDEACVPEYYIQAIEQWIALGAPR